MTSFYTKVLSAAFMFAAATAAQADEAVFDFSAGVPTSVNGVTLTTESSWNDYLQCLQIYCSSYSGTIRPATFTAPAGATISKIVFEEASAATNYGFLYVIYGEEGDLYEVNEDYTELIWQGSPANSVTIRPVDTSMYVSKATVTFEMEGANAINSVETTTATVTYDLNGRRISNAKGLVIANGVKTFVK